MTCDWWLDDSRQCHRPARAMFADFLSGTRYHRCSRHDTRRKRAEMSAAGFARYDVQKPLQGPSLSAGRPETPSAASGALWPEAAA